MKSSDIAVIPRGGALAKTNNKAKLATVGFALVNQELDADLVQALVDADKFRVVMQDPNIPYLGDAKGELEIIFLDRAKPLHARWLPNLLRAVDANNRLTSILWGLRSQLTQADASVMLQYLFGAMSKRRDDDAAAKLLACADIFSPASNALGQAFGLWKPVPTHPAILALAIKQLMAAKIFEPAEAELREVLGKVQQRLAVQNEYINQWLAKIDRADEIVFTFDRPAWDEAYRAVGSRVANEMHGMLYEDDWDEDHEHTPRWKALLELWEMKTAAEEAKLEQQPPKRLAAASKRSQTKRSKKLKETTLS